MKTWMVIITLLLCTLTSGAVAANSFDPEQALTTLESYQSALKSNHLSLKQLERNIQHLLDLQDVAKECASTNKRELIEINEILKEENVKLLASHLTETEASYLKQRQALLSSRLSGCKLFAFRSKETIGNYSTRIQALITGRLLRFNSNIVGAIDKLTHAKNGLLSWKKINESPVKPSLFLAFIGLLLIVTFFVRRKVLALPKRNSTKRVVGLTVILGGLVLSGVAFYFLIYPSLLSEEVYRIIGIAYLTTLSLGCVVLLRFMMLLPPWIWCRNIIRNTIFMFFMFVFLSVIVFDWVGLHNLAIHIIKSVGWLALVITLAVLMQILTSYLFNKLEGKEHPWQQKMRRLIGLSHRRVFLEVFWLKCVAYLYIWFAAMFYILNFAGLSSAELSMLLDAFFEGFKVADVAIVPAHILMGLLVFALLSIVVRFLRASFNKLHLGKGEMGRHEAISAIINYAGFSLALLLGLLISGVNLTGLAIIAGALSVGIGFGLRDIVNNFLSGLVLLFEQPVKPGDRIVIGDTEGFVNKVGVRSTQVKTMANSDVIVPNADFISKQITNFMFRDTFWRIVIDVGVVYGSDVELVKELLYKVAHGHPDVVKDIAGKEPLVLFREFGDSSLNFELWCIISDVNKKYIVPSELNFAVDKEFRAHNVVIAFPQRDLHIKEWPGLKDKSDEKKE